MPNVIKAFNNEEETGQKVLILDIDNTFEGSLIALNEMNLGYEFEISNDNIDMNGIKDKISNKNIDSCIKITKTENGMLLEYITENITMFSMPAESVLEPFKTIYKELQISKLGLTETELLALNPQIDFDTIETSENTAKGNPLVMMILSIVLFYAIYFCAYQVSSSITTEKTSRIIETLITSTKPKTIVLGKTLGIGIVGLIQITVIITVVIISANAFLEPGFLSSILDMSSLTPMLAIITFVYFILGYSIFSLLYALTGSTVSKPEDINSANSPIAMIAVVGFYLSYFSMMNPTSDINLLAAMLPISSPFSMPFRVMMGVATTGEILASIGILIVCILAIAQISIKIYSSAILNNGARLGIKDLVKIYKNKN